MKHASGPGCGPRNRRRLVKDHAAEADLVGIWVYTFENWGEARADSYLRILERGMERIAADPEDGERRDDLRDGYWSSRFAHHVAFYTFDADEVRLRRMLHEVMDAGRHL